MLCKAAASAIAQATGQRCLPVSCHVGDWSQCAELVDSTVSEFGRVDILINNAGIAPVAPSLHGVTEELFDKTIGVNSERPTEAGRSCSGAHAARRLDHQYQLCRIGAADAIHGCLWRGESGPEQSHQGYGSRVRAEGNSD